MKSKGKPLCLLACNVQLNYDGLMVKINKIYTKTGDDGTTGLVGGARVRKDSVKVSAYGDIDELNSFIGWARTIATADFAEKLAQIQNELFDLGAELATPTDSKTNKVPKIPAAFATRLEQWIDEVTERVPELRSFVLPGGTELNARLHICRTVCRRAERSVLRLSQEEKVSSDAIIYLNRLSDFLFALARAESHRASVPEYLWKPGA